MKYNVELSKRSEKFLKSCPIKMRQHLLEQLAALEDSPREHGIMLHGEWRGLHRMKLFYNSTQYRAIYEIIENKITVLVLFIDKREGFYETLKRMKIAKR